MGILRWYAEAFLQQGALQKLHKHGYHSGYHSQCEFVTTVVMWRSFAYGEKHFTGAAAKTKKGAEQAAAALAIVELTINPRAFDEFNMTRASWRTR